jgi:hypothetical protein
MGLEEVVHLYIFDTFPRCKFLLCALHQATHVAVPEYLSQRSFYTHQHQVHFFVALDGLLYPQHKPTLVPAVLGLVLVVVWKLLE